MSERWPDLAGRIEGAVHRLAIRVYYEDTDFSGAVYHANYLKFCERARSDCLRLLGVHQGEMHWHETDGRMGFVVRKMVCDFLKPARIDDLIEVETRFQEMAGARLELQQTVLRGTDTLFVAHVTIALVDGQGRPKRMPERLKSAVAGLLSPQKVTQT